MLSAIPDTIWSLRRWIAATAWIAASPAPTAIAATSATTTLCD